MAEQAEQATDDPSPVKRLFQAVRGERLYAIKEVFKTLQGEGANVGRPAVFVRFAGCNLACPWCDTDFSGGESWDLGRLMRVVRAVWGRRDDYRGRFVVLTGGEPLLQVDALLLGELAENHFRIAVESNGTIKCPDGVQHLTVSPKAGAPVEQHDADELKFIYPQEGLSPEEARDLVVAPVNFLQPMDGPRRAENTQAAIDYCLSHPWWRLSLQTHKILGLR